MRPGVKSASSSADPAAISLVTSADGVSLGVRVSPGAKRTRVLGAYGDRLKVQVAAPPEDDRANRELLEALSGWFAVPRGYVELRAGYRSRDKIILVRGVEEGALRVRLSALPPFSSR